MGMEAFMRHLGCKVLGSVTNLINKVRDARTVAKLLTPHSTPLLDTYELLRARDARKALPATPDEIAYVEDALRRTAR